ncbi:hypothetical protein [Streptomyces sp. NPDC087437]|uniref:hypothetical protein n=1 Tax=Streptomyces sp. NPDC087437 TaxID=3365789 RepID=UPI0038085DD5
MAGLLTTAFGTLFYRPADLALKQMELQTPSLHPDMKVEQDTGQAIRLLESNEAPTLKAHLQAALILRFAAANQSKLGGVLKSIEPLSPSNVNGILLQ